MIKILGFCGLIAPGLVLAASKEYGNVTVDQVTSVYDADTFRVTIAGWPPLIGERIPIRVNGIDAPEIKGRCKKEKILARQAKQATVTFLRSGKKIELKRPRRGKYFRIVADVYVGGVNLADHLLKKGLARRYDGGKKSSWCQ